MRNRVFHVFEVSLKNPQKTLANRNVTIHTAGSSGQTGFTFSKGCPSWSSLSSEVGVSMFKVAMTVVVKVSNEVSNGVSNKVSNGGNADDAGGQRSKPFKFYGLNETKKHTDLANMVVKNATVLASVSRAWPCVVVCQMSNDGQLFFACFCLSSRA